MQIKKITLHRFKKFKNTSISLKKNLSLLTGPNNSGKSSILQALATWQFCKTYLEVEKGRESWLETKNKAGIGVSMSDFTPIQIPSLNHLWSNLKSSKVNEVDGYTLKIGVYWDVEKIGERHLEIGLSLANDRLFIKTTSTNILMEEVVGKNGEYLEGSVPNIGYLPPFAGITDKELRLSHAMKARLIGQGLSGGVIRNVIYELHENNKKKREQLKNGTRKIKSSDLRCLRDNDPWEILQQTIKDVFQTELLVRPFNDLFHSYLRIETKKGKIYNESGKAVYKSFPGYNSRDLMVEGSGFLQWLSVYALTLSPDIDVVLLDEPDAHLNAALQKELLNSLSDISDKKNKQVLMATHSPELIRMFDHNKILSVEKDKNKYLADDSSKIALLAGIGTNHTPTLHSLSENKRMLILEAKSDLRFLKILAEKYEFDWPKNIVPWYWTGSAKERRQLFLQLSAEIPGLLAISLRDRDDESASTVGDDLLDKNYNQEENFKILKWPRRNIEGYILCKAAIARAAKTSIESVDDYFRIEHSVFVPDNLIGNDIPPALRDLDCKKIFNGEDGIEKRFKIKREDVAMAMEKSDIPNDIRTFFEYLKELSTH